MITRFASFAYDFDLRPCGKVPVIVCEQCRKRAEGELKVGRCRLTLCNPS
jgi:hypothetical protein